MDGYVESVRLLGCGADGGARRLARRLRCGHEPVRRPQPNARLGVRARVQRAGVERAEAQLRADRDLAAGRPGYRECPGRGGIDDRSGTGRRRPQQREHGDTDRRAVVDHEHVPLAASGGLLLSAVCRRGLRHAGYRPRVRPHDREPHDREGPHPAGPPRRNDGRVPRRPVRDGVRQLERVRPRRGREPVRRRRLRHRQPVPRDPKLRDEHADGGRRPAAGQAAPDQHAELRVDGLRRHRPTGPCGR